MTEQSKGIQLHRVSKRYGSQTILKDVDLEIDPGELIVILGPSGSGKSVLMRILLGLEKPDEGEVFIDKINIYDSLSAQINPPKFGVVFQGGTLFPDMTVQDNVRFPLMIHGEPDDGRTEQVLEDVMYDLNQINRFPHHLSGGMKQRVALARALVTQPGFLFFDEPTVGLDPSTSDTICRLIRSKHEQTDATTIMITHDIRCSAMVADRIYYLDQSSYGVRILLDRDELSRMRQNLPLESIEALIRSKMPVEPRISHTITHEITSMKRFWQDDIFNIGSAIVCIFTAMRRIRFRSDSSGFLQRLTEMIFPSIPIITISGFLIGLALLLSTFSALLVYGQENNAPEILGTAIVLEIGPLLAGLLLAGRLGSSITAEFGLKTEGHDFDAMKTMGADVDKLFFTPLFCATMIAFPILLGMMDTAGYLGGLFGFTMIKNRSDTIFYTGFCQSLHLYDALFTGLKGLAFGFIILSISYQNGLDVRFPERSIGKQVTKTVVNASLMIIAGNFLIMRIYDWLF